MHTITQAHNHKCARAQGPLAAVARRAAYLYRQPTNEQRLNVAASWLSQAGSIANSVLESLPTAPQPGR